MAKDTTEVITGGGTLYIAPYGTAFPADAETAPAGTWVDAGYTDEGCVIEVEQTFVDVEVDELPYAIATRLEKTVATLSSDLAQFSLENIKTALNGGTITAIPGPPVRNTYTPPISGEEAAVAALFRFVNEFGFHTDVQMPKVINVSSTSSTFKTRGATKTLIPVKLQMVGETGVDLFTIDEYESAT